MQLLNSISIVIIYCLEKNTNQYKFCEELKVRILEERMRKREKDKVQEKENNSERERERDLSLLAGRRWRH